MSGALCLKRDVNWRRRYLSVMSAILIFGVVVFSFDRGIFAYIGQGLFFIMMFAATIWPLFAAKNYTRHRLHISTAGVGKYHEMAEKR